MDSFAALSSSSSSCFLLLSRLYNNNNNNNNQRQCTIRRRRNETCVAGIPSINNREMTDFFGNYFNLITISGKRKKKKPPSSFLILSSFSERKRKHIAIVDNDLFPQQICNCDKRPNDNKDPPPLLAAAAADKTCRSNYLFFFPSLPLHSSGRSVRSRALQHAQSA